MTPVAYLGGSPKVQRLLDRVTAQLPPEVESFVVQQICFIAVGASHGHGQTWNRRHINPSQAWESGVAEWVVVLTEERVTERLAAHEIAHAWSGHGDGPRDKEEEEANRLATQWGFPPDPR